jgi:hypothetical protein
MLLSAADELAMGQQTDPQVLQTFGKYEDADLAGVVAHEIGHIAAQISVFGPCGLEGRQHIISSADVQSRTECDHPLLNGRRGLGRIFFMTFSLMGRGVRVISVAFERPRGFLSRFRYFQLNGSI